MMFDYQLLFTIQALNLFSFIASQPPSLFILSFEPSALILSPLAFYLFSLFTIQTLTLIAATTTLLFPFTQANFTGFYISALRPF
jgi:hypothetical protein